MRRMAVLTIATCQFPVSADITANLRHIKRQMDLASQRGARVAHFPEGALSGYAGTDFPTFVTISTHHPAPPPGHRSRPHGGQLPGAQQTRYLR